MSHSGELYNIVLLQNKRLQFMEEKIRKLEEKYEDQQRLFYLIRNLVDKDLLPKTDDKELFEIDYLKEVFTDKDVDLTNFYATQISNKNDYDSDELIPSHLFDT